MIALPNRNAEAAAVQPAEPAPAGERWKGVAAPNSPVATGLDAIVAADSSFDAKSFIAGARGAYEMIVNAYAEGDRRTLKSLLSREVYEGFEGAITEREKRGETVESHFVSLDEAEITGAELRQRTAQVTRALRLQADHRHPRQRGQGDRRQRREGQGRHRHLDLRPRRHSRDPNWKLVATEAGQ